MRMFDCKEKKRVYFITLITMLVFICLFLNSFYWPSKQVDKRKILVMAIAFFGVVIVPFLAIRINAFYCMLLKCIATVKETWIEMRANKTKVFSFFCYSLIGIGASGIITFFISKFVFEKSFNEHLFYTMVLFYIGALLMGQIWKRADKKPENVFVIIALVMGIFCISVTPTRVGVSWDDEIHYARTLEISNALNGIMYQADEKNIADYGININTRSGYDRTSDKAYTEELETLYADKAWSEHAFRQYNVWSIGYVPAAIGIILARGLNLSYSAVFNAGRLFNLLTYIVLIYFAMKRVKYGKVLIGVIGVIPTTIFMASSYAYDPWVTGFTILGFSYFVAELQEDKPLRYNNILIMVGAIILGCMPKAIYFTVLFPLLFMPKKKFENTKQRRNYYLLIIVSGIFLVATFMLPMLMDTSGAGDARGGTDVNSTEQIKFILQNPLRYSKILLEFLRGYFAPESSAGMLQRLAYIGHGYLYGIVSLIISSVAFLDRGEEESNFWGVRVSSLIGCAAAMVLSTTALYISFTAVAADTVAGMQGRYILPTIYPALYALGFAGVSHKINKKAFVCVPMILIALTFFYNMVGYCVLHY